MTLTWSADLVRDRAQQERWQPMVSSCAPGFAAAVTMTDRLRLVVLDLADPDGLEVEEAFDTALHAADLAERLVAADLGRARCPSVAIADLFPDGTLDLQVRNAPPALLLRPGAPARLLPAVSQGGRNDQMAPGEVLLLCSASFLEDPPTVLGTVRRLPTTADLANLRQALSAAPHPGATASVASTSGDGRPLAYRRGR